MLFRGEDLQEPDGEPYSKDSFIYTGFPKYSLKCAICGREASRLVMCEIEKGICDVCK